MEATCMSIDRWMEKRCGIHTTDYYSTINKNGIIPYAATWMDHIKWSKRKTNIIWYHLSVQSLSHVWLCNPMNRSMPSLPVHHQLPESTQTHAHRVGDAIHSSHPLSSPSPPVLNFSQHQGLFKWVSSPHEVAKVLEFQLQCQSFQSTFRTDFL